MLDVVGSSYSILKCGFFEYIPLAFYIVVIRLSVAA